MSDYNNLFTFVKVVENRSFTVTAEELNISQPAVSKRIENLEKELCITLLIRNSRGISLTEDGELLYKTASLSFVSIINIIFRLQQKKRLDKKISITYDASGTLTYVIDCLPEFIKNNPGTDIELKHDTYNKSKEEIISGNADIMFTAVMENEVLDKRFLHTKVLQDKLCLLVRSDHPFASKNSVALSDINDETLITINQGSPMSELVKGNEFVKIIESESYTILADMVLMGLGIAFWINSLPCEKSNLKMVSIDNCPEVFVCAVTSLTPKSATKKLLAILSKNFKSS